MKHTIEVLSFKPLVKNTLCGFAKIRINELKLVINDVTLHQKGATRWAGLPGKPQINKDGQAIRDNRGKIAYAAILEFENRAASDAFSRAVWAAVESSTKVEAVKLMEPVP